MPTLEQAGFPKSVMDVMLASNKPIIGENGHWYIGEVDTNIDAIYNTEVGISIHESTSGNSIHASTHATGGSDPITPASIGAITPAIDLFATLTVEAWTGTEAPYSQTISNLSGVLVSSKLDIGLAETATDEQYTEAGSALIRAISSNTGSVTFKAYGIKPTVALPVIIRMVN